MHSDNDGVVRNVTISLRSRSTREKLMLYKTRKPMKMVVGVQRLVLICPSEEIQEQLGCVTSDERNMKGKKSVTVIKQFQLMVRIQLKKTISLEVMKRRKTSVL